MSSELALQPTHICNINVTPNADAAPLRDDTLTLLFNSLEEHSKIWGPRTPEQCLRGDKHTQACVKDLTNEELNLHVRRVQTAFLQKVIGEKWGEPFMCDLLQTVPTDALETFRFLAAIPHKERPTWEGKPDYTSDLELYRACKKTNDVALSIDVFNAALQTKEPELVISAFKILQSDSGKLAKVFLEKIHNALFLLSGDKDKDKSQAVSKRLFTLLGTTVSDSEHVAWTHFIGLFEEYYLIDSQLGNSSFASAFSTANNRTVELDFDSKLYDNLHGLLHSDDPESFWKKIPKDLEKRIRSQLCLPTHKSASYVSK